ncbi:hypothetical protein [Legionella adelaidensis]|uniref:hypothetical protein n=1 Tax=Legionella adelaidensis TaxID=45056 RepID=UPI000731B4C3|nr:hypothetical protein [Legionella adelaidensis]
MKFVFSLLSSIFKEIKSSAFIIESLDEDPKSGLFFFWVKVKNKSLQPIRKDPLELLREIRSRNCFSSKDYDWIINILLENQKRLTEKKHQKPFSFIKHQYSEHLNETLIVFRDSNNKIHVKKAKEIYFDSSNLKKFNSVDCACIGYIVGTHDIEQDFKLKTNQKINKQSKIKCDISLLSG